MTTLERAFVACAVGALGMVAQTLRATTCETPPLFDLSGPNCGVSRQGVQCACSECLVWDAAAGAKWYQIHRCDSSGENCTIVGDTRFRNHTSFTDSDGVSHPGIPPTLWCVAWDEPFPQFNVSYDYSVRTCTDGASGPVCSLGLSNPVTYVTAPYLCITEGLEVACETAAPNPSPFATDLDADGTTDAIDLDDDGDGVPDLVDKCPRTRNIGQRDADGDGVGDARDADPRIAGSGPADADRDGVGDRLDVCPAVPDAFQADADRDRTRDACDNCPSEFNEMQSDFDGDDQGDHCDLDDGTIYAVWRSRSRLVWAEEAGLSTWCVYRGDLAELRQSGTYTQAPGSNSLAARFCALTAASIDDATAPAPRGTSFYLVAGRPGPTSIELGLDSAGDARPNANPCP